MFCFSFLALTLYAFIVFLNIFFKSLNFFLIFFDFFINNLLMFCVSQIINITFSYVELFSVELAYDAEVKHIRFCMQRVLKGFENLSWSGLNSLFSFNCYNCCIPESLTVTSFALSKAFVLHLHFADELVNKKKKKKIDFFIEIFF